jgi:hypothetical protein
MKKIIGAIITILILALIGWFVYYFFIDCEKFDFEYERHFTLTKMDYAVINDEVTIKLINIKDETYVDSDGTKSGEIVYKLIVKDDYRMKFVTLGSFSNPVVKPEKMDYEITLIKMDENNNPTFSVKKLEAKKY